MRTIAVPVVTGLLLLGACSSGSSGSSAPTGSTGARIGPAPTGSAPPVGPSTTYDEAQLRATFESTAAALGTAGAVAVVQTPGGELRAAYGTTTWGGSTPTSLDDHVRIGSVTKTFTGTVILQLAQEGRLALADPVATFRPDVPNGRNITITELLNMRSGLFNYAEAPELNEALDATPDRVWTPDELLRIAFANPPYFPPGQGYHYSNTNTVLLGLVAEQLDGKPLATIFQDRLFTPLHMRQTSFPPATTAAIPERHPQGYMFGTNVGTMRSAALPPAQQAAAEAGTLAPHDVTDVNPSWTWAAGQSISTADDLVTWAKALADGTLLDPEHQKLRLESPQPQTPDAPPAAPQYGLGIGRFGTLYGHTGELPGFSTIAVHDPAAGVTVVVWANLGSSPAGQPVATTIGRALIDRLYGTASDAATVPPSAGTAPAGTATTTAR